VNAPTSPADQRALFLWNHWTEGWPAKTGADTDTGGLTWKAPPPAKADKRARR
jgi:hypothetical protein